MNGRVERLRGELTGVGAASFLASDPHNVQYLTGFASTNAWALVRPAGVLLVTDGRYAEAARAVAGVEVVVGERNLAPWLGVRLAELAEPPVGFEADRVTVAAHEALAADGVELTPTTGLVPRLRAVKEAEEAAAIRRAARLVDAALERFAGEPAIGRTEAEVAWWLERALREAGADAVAFPVIVASGPNAALPHHRPGEREIGADETVLVDVGARVDGYCSDCTRTFATGALSAELRHAYSSCRSAQEEALARVRAGAEARGLDAVARSALEADGYEVVHGLGHGVGMEVHELPVLRPEADGELVAGNVVTIEPGVYLAGRGGVRIEDLVLVGDDGAEVLSRFTKELLTLG